MNNILLQFRSYILLVAVAIGLLFPHISFAKTPAHDYLVKLHTNDIAVLSGFAKNIEAQFANSSDQSLQNIYRFESNLTLNQIQQLTQTSAEYVEYDNELSIGAREVVKLPNDPGFSSNGSNIDKQWGLVKAGFTDAWKRTTGKTKTTVAVIDTGIDGTHEDFSGTHFVAGYNVINSKNILAGSNSDDNGHGTLVAGIIGATTNNKKGIAGTNENVSLMPVKALSKSGSGSASNIAKAIVWATDHDADVINLSLGGFKLSHNQTLADSVSYAYDNNVVVIAAAGNDVAITGGNLDEKPVFPICNDNGKNMVIGVTATDQNDLKPDFANFGKACVDVTAPGKRILSLINYDPATGIESPDSYAYASGTSMAVPFVSGQAALLKSFSPNMSNKQIRDAIISTTDSIDKLNLSQCAGSSCAGMLGSGRINVVKSIQRSASAISDGDVVFTKNSSDLYFINGGRKQLITAFVRNQRFANASPREVSKSDLDTFQTGTLAEPLDGTLIKANSDGTVYYMSGGLRLPVTAKVFSLRKFSFANVFSLSTTEVNSWVLGSLLTPPESTLIRSPNNPTLYWVSNQMLHPVNYNFYMQRGLHIFPVVFMNDDEIKQFTIGETFSL